MNSGKLIIRKLGIADAADLLAFSKKTFYEFFAGLNDPVNMEAYSATAFTQEKIATELSNPGSQFYFAVLSGQITGYLKLNFGDAQTEFRDQTALEIERIYVSREHHGKNIGGTLMNFALQTAVDMNLNYLWLGVWEHNLKAIGFYKRFGFEVFGSHEFLLGSDRQTDLLMKKEISGSI